MIWTSVITHQQLIWAISSSGKAVSPPSVISHLISLSLSLPIRLSEHHHQSIIGPSIHHRSTLVLWAIINPSSVFSVLTSCKVVAGHTSLFLVWAEPGEACRASSMHSAMVPLKNLEHHDLLTGVAPPSRDQFSTSLPHRHPSPASLALSVQTSERRNSQKKKKREREEMKRWNERKKEKKKRRDKKTKKVKKINNWACGLLAQVLFFCYNLQVKFNLIFFLPRFNLI